jgi:hypothetical protein
VGVLASRAVPTWTRVTRAALMAILLFGCEKSAPPAAAQRAPDAPIDAAPPRPPPPGAPEAASPAGEGAPSPPATPASPTPDARLAATVSAPPVEVLEAQALIPGAATPLKQGELITVDPGASFRVVLKGTYLDARLSLLDGGDAMVAAGGAREAGQDTAVTLQPAAPLKPGSAYRLRVDGATTRELRAADGSARAPVEFPVLAAGEPPPEPKTRPKRAKKRP